MALAEFGDPADATAALKRAGSSARTKASSCSLERLDDAAAAATCTRQGLAIIEHQSSLGDPDADERVCGTCCAPRQPAKSPPRTTSVHGAARQRLSGARRGSLVRGAEPIKAVRPAEEHARKDGAWRRCAGRWRLGARGEADERSPTRMRTTTRRTSSRRVRGERSSSGETAKLLLELDENTEEA